MAQLKKLLASLTGRQKISIALAAVLVAGSLIGLTRWQRERDFQPLYSGLATEDAGQVVESLRERGVEFRLTANGTTVLVPSAQVAEMRLLLASAGLPKTGRMGFELFDQNNFGVTDFTEHVNYRRALEGELERSVMSLSEVEQARVHLTFPKDSVFLEARQPAKASVMLRLRAGSRLSPANVQAVSQLVASAVEGLAPEAVAVLDMRGNLLSKARAAVGPDGEPGSEAALEFRQRLERDLLAKINSTLEPLVGAERFRAGVSVECDLTSGELSEEFFDPGKSVVLTSQKSEETSGAAATAGVPGTASNLPRAEAKTTTGGSALARRTENVAYQSARTVRRMRLPQGAVKRMSLAILLDQDARWEGTGANAKRILEPPSPEKLKVIREVVAAATGFSSERGDQLIVETLPFESTLTSAPPEDPAPAVPAAQQIGEPASEWLKLIEQHRTIAIAAGAGLLVLLVIARVLNRLRKRREKAKSPEMNAALPSGKAIEDGGEFEAPQPSFEQRLADQAALKQKMENEALNALKLPPVTTKKTEVLVKHLSETSKKDPVAAVQIIRGWLNESER